MAVDFSRAGDSFTVQALYLRLKFGNEKEKRNSDSGASLSADCVGDGTLFIGGTAPPGVRGTTVFE